MKRIIIALCLWMVKCLLTFYLWMYDYADYDAPNADIHRKIIWELREFLKGFKN